MKLNIENQENLILYLRDKGLLPEGEKLQVEVLRGGVSNRTVCIRKEDGTSWVLKQALEKLRVKEDWFSHPRRVVLEAKGIQWFSSLCPTGSVPQLIFLDEEQYVLGMEAVLKPHDNFKELLLSGEGSSDYFEQFGQLLGTIHAQASSLESEIAKTFVDSSFFESLRLEPYYEFTAQQVPEASNFLYELIEICRASSYTLVHGDYSPKNILIYQGKLVLLDFEVVHYGDGTFDIGFALTHLLSKAHHLSPFRSYLLAGAQAFCRSYWQAVEKDWTLEKEARAVRHTLACLLARVHGRSPLEYLSQEEKDRQTRIVLSLMKNPPQHLLELIEKFEQNLSNA